MKRLFQSLLLILTTAADRELARIVQHLKAEYRILRANLPKRITVTARERRTLLKYGKPLGAKLKEIISIVSPRTFARWLVSEAETPRRKANEKPGRPKTRDEIRKLVIRLARENSWGYTQILGELKKLGVGKICRSTVLKILREEGIESPTHLPRDHDGKFVAEFDAILESDDVKVTPICVRAPNMNATAERWVQSVRNECLDHFVIFGESHLRHLLSEYLDFYHQARPHQGLGNVPLSGTSPPQEAALISLIEIACQERLGGLLKGYSRRAA